MSGLLYLTEWLNANVFSWVLTVLIFGTGIFFFIKLRFFPLSRPAAFLKALSGSSDSNKKSGDISPFRAVTLALAGTLGVGNIIGVAAAIAAGGFGSVFWMWCSSFAAMLVKYAEIVLAVRTRRSEKAPDGSTIYHGGAMYYIKFLPAAVLFAALCCSGSLFLGNIIQVRAAAEAMHSVFGIPEISVGITAAVVCAVIIGGGVRSISDFTVKLIPLLSALYIVASLWIILSNSARVPGLISEIISRAISPEALSGGLEGFLIQSGIRYGISRGLFSNEAGCGTAPIAHSGARVKSAAAQGCWGIFEVFADTVLLCSMTAFVIMLAYDAVGAECVSDPGGMLLAISSYSLFLGDGAGIFIALSTAFFSLATLVCWAHYGMESLGFICALRKKKSCAKEHSHKIPGYIYTAVYCVSAVAGSVMTADIIWSVSDLAVATMTVLNVVAVTSRWKEIKSETDAVFFDAARGRIS